uniref:Rhizoctonia solani AG1-IB WGS project CAOJ00000000 data, isolate 7/3/14, contig n=2 Tax=Macrostomum lignano TaxID=282301 RepID=A0A1I8HPY3_9PLAT
MGNSAFVQRIREREELRRESRREELLAFAESCQQLQAETVDNAKALLGRQLLKSAEGSVAEFANITRDQASNSLDDSEVNDNELSSFGDFAAAPSRLDPLVEKRIERLRRESYRDEVENLGAATGVGYYDHGDLGREDPTRNREILYNQSDDYEVQASSGDATATAAAASLQQQQQLAARADDDEHFYSAGDLQRSRSNSPTLMGGASESAFEGAGAFDAAPMSTSTPASSSASLYSAYSEDDGSSCCSDDH